MFDPFDIFGICDELWPLPAENLKYLRIAQEPPVRPALPPVLRDAFHAHGSAYCLQLPSAYKGGKGSDL